MIIKLFRRRRLEIRDCFLDLRDQTLVLGSGWAESRERSV